MANQTAEQVTENLFQAVDTIIKQRVSNLPYDQTIICEITNADNAQYGRYLAKTYSQSNGYNDVSFTVYSDNTEYVVGDRVYVRIPAGDYTQQKVITGNYVAERQDSTLVSTDSYWIASEIVLDEETSRFDITDSDIIYDLEDGRVFPGYQAFRIKFRPHIDERLVGMPYNIADLDVKFNISIQYTVPNVLNSAVLTRDFIVSLRALNPNLFRNPNKILSYDIDLYNVVANSPVQLRRITLSNLSYRGNSAEDFDGTQVLYFDDVSLTFGYYLTNNIDSFLTLYTDSVFYSPLETSIRNHIVYAHYYDCSNITDKILEPILAAESDLKASFDGNAVIPNVVIENAEEMGYSIAIPISTGTPDTLNNERYTYTVFLTSTLQQDRIVAQDSIDLINVDYYATLSGNIGNASSFLIAKQLDPSEEELYNYNNGIYYIYGQDGKPTDSSASFITRRAYIRLVDYYDPNNNFNNGNLTARVSGNSMIIPIDNICHIVPSHPEEAYFEFKISNYYAQNKKDNSIIWTYTPNDSQTSYTYEQELMFGYSGSQGADYSLILSLTSNGKEIPAIVMGQNATYKIVPHLYDYSNNEVISGISFSYSKVNTGAGRWPSWLNLDENGNLTVNGYVAPSEADRTTYYCPIVKTSITDLSIEAFMPIALAQEADTFLSGPTTITYDITGKKPFTSKVPYKLYREGSAPLIQITCELIIPKESPSEALKSLYPKLDGLSLILPSAYSTEMRDAPPTIIIKNNGQTVWIQPLYIWQNKYPNSMTNGEANKVIIPEKDGNRQIINTNVGRVLTNGAGMFIGDYGTASSSQYGLYAFKPIDDEYVENIFKLTANGVSATEDLAFNNIAVSGEDRAATVKDLVNAINILKTALLTVITDPTQTAKLNTIDLEIMENG